jgi:hypothetical protein
MRKVVSVFIAATMLTSISTIASATDDVVDKSFFPYKNGLPSHQFVKPGIVINSSNVDQAKDVLDDALFEAVKNGWYDIKVGQTEQIEMNPAYVDATRKGYTGVSLGEILGQIKGYVSGRPFPQEPDVNDPRAGEKIAWNFRFGLNTGDAAVFSPFYWTYRNMADGAIERVLKMSMHFLNFKHRTMLDPKPDIEPNPSEIYRGIYTKVLEPQDVAETQLLIHRFEDDTKLDASWLYLGFQRRVRKLSTGQVTDSFLGSDVMIEDFDGYNGRVSDMKWNFKGTRFILVPFFRHNEMSLSTERAEPDYKFIAFGGKGNCFPNVTWQLRKVYEVDVVPVDPNHPISKRTMFFDAQQMAVVRSLVYDRSGKLWKNFMLGMSMPNAHLPANKDAGFAMYEFFSMIDTQNLHCTTGQVKSLADPSQSPVSRFAVDGLRTAN